ALLRDQAAVVVDDRLERLAGVLGAGLVDGQAVDRLADLLDVGGRLLQLPVDAAAEADDGVGERAGPLLVAGGVDLQLAGDAVALVLDGALVVLHAPRLVEHPDDGELVRLEVAEDLAGELVEGDADVLGLVRHVAGDRRAAHAAAVAAAHAAHAEVLQRHRR